MTLFVLSGISGSGKTHTRLNDPRFKDLKHFDIADIYAKHHGDISMYAAFMILCDQIIDEIKNGDVVVELFASSWRKEFLNDLAEEHGFEIEFIQLSESVDVCVERVQKQMAEEKKNGTFNEERKRYHEWRLNWLKNITERENSYVAFSKERFVDGDSSPFDLPIFNTKRRIGIFGKTKCFFSGMCSRFIGFAKALCRSKT